MQRLEELIETQFVEPTQTGGIHSGSFQISDVQFAWETSFPAEEYLYLHGMLWKLVDEDEEKPTTYSLSFQISIG